MMERGRPRPCLPRDGRGRPSSNRTTSGVTIHTGKCAIVEIAAKPFIYGDYLWLTFMPHYGFVWMPSRARKEVADFLRGGLAIVQEEPATTAWFAIQMGPSTFGIFDAFPNEAGRQAHLSGRVAAALMAKAPDLLAKPPAIEKIDVLAAKLPA